jgi:hypothetical protein
MFNKIQAINKLLDDQGAAAVQKKPSVGSKPALYGYRPQLVMDSVNEVLGPLGWSHDVKIIEFNERQAIVEVSVAIESRISVQFGEAQIVKGDKGSAAKGAVTDGIQKALSLFGVGSKAYRGELEAVFNSKISETVVDDKFEAMVEAAKVQAKISVEAGRVWWRQNLAQIKILSEEQRKELVEILADKK